MEENNTIIICPECGIAGYEGAQFEDRDGIQVQCENCNSVFPKAGNIWIKVEEMNTLKWDMGIDGDANIDEACHQRRHQFLHKGLDELLAQFITETRANILEVPIMELIHWSSDVANGKGHRGHGNH